MRTTIDFYKEMSLSRYAYNCDPIKGAILKRHIYDTLNRVYEIKQDVTLAPHIVSSDFILLNVNWCLNIKWSKWRGSKY